MTDSEFSDKKILQIWETSAVRRARATETGAIASRRLVTDAAIVAALLESRPGTVLDAGCAEGSPAACGEEDYCDGWRAGSWAGFGEHFANPAPWYFRATGSWIDRFRFNGLELVQLHRPQHPGTRQPASLIPVVSRRD